MSSEEFNILLLGETGVGKSTFINAFVNFLQHTTFNNARVSQLACLIPLKFVIPNENFEEQVIQFGFDKNEDTVLGNSSTQETKAYVFPFEEYKIRLIDTPGIGDARGLAQDEKNFENVLDYIGRYEKLHAICFLLKPNVSVINAYFKFCLMHLISRLERSAINNIVFIFTNSRNTFYRPGDTLPLLKRILQEIKQSAPFVEVPLSKDNMFCIDNEAFKFLIAMRHGIRFNGAEVNEFRKSWRTSYKTCKDLIYYICGGKGKDSIKPHRVEDTISVNKARKTILHLMKPIADIVEFILENIQILRKQIDDISQDRLSTEQLKKKLYVPRVQQRIKTCSSPMTVCVSSKCGNPNRIGKSKTICHKPCYLTHIEAGIIGALALRNCSAFIGINCRHCSCSYEEHMHIYYETEIVESIQENQGVKVLINSKTDAINAANNLVVSLKSSIKEYISELHMITKCMARFFLFLKNNSISSNNDDYLEYLTYIIKRENSSKNKSRINFYNNLRETYIKAKNELISSNEKITPQEIPNLITILYDLKLTGPQISMLHSVQRDCVVKSLNKQEYKYPKIMKYFVDDDNSDDDDDDDDDDCDYVDDKMDASTIYCPAFEQTLEEENESDNDQNEDFQNIKKLSKDELNCQNLPSSSKETLQQISYDIENYQSQKTFESNEFIASNFSEDKEKYKEKDEKKYGYDLKGGKHYSGDDKNKSTTLYKCDNTGEISSRNSIKNKYTEYSIEESEKHLNQPMECDDFTQTLLVDAARLEQNLHSNATAASHDSDFTISSLTKGMNNLSSNKEKYNENNCNKCRDVLQGGKSSDHEGKIKSVILYDNNIPGEISNNSSILNKNTNTENSDQELQKYFSNATFEENLHSKAVAADSRNTMPPMKNYDYSISPKPEATNYLSGDKEKYNENHEETYSDVLKKGKYSDRDDDKYKSTISHKRNNPGVISNDRGSTSTSSSHVGVVRGSDSKTKEANEAHGKTRGRGNNKSSKTSGFKSYISKWSPW